ncbi:MAG: sigma-70 family RNA polymerase sigma factor [Cytophagales bacterium]|nr:sigma-70 family RNA polymerase sigma factor [Cytophagales bacterium]
MSKLYEQNVLPVSQKMYRYALTILKNEDSAHDVVQECLMKIWNKRAKLIEIENHEAWAMRITRNQCFDWVKTNRFTILQKEQVEEPDQIKADHDTLMEDQKKWLGKVLKTLPQKQKEIFHLREIDGMTYQEISDILSLSLSEVKVYLHRARTKVRSSLQKIEAYGIAN